MADIKDNVSSLFRKTTILKYLPENSCNLYLDSDTIVLDSLDELFDMVRQKQLVFTNFAEWKTGGRKIGGRIDEWKPIIGESEHEKAKAFGPAVNTGVFGFVVNKHTRRFFADWEDTCLRGAKAGCTPKVLDELAAQVLLHKWDIFVTQDTRWNHSVKYGNTKEKAIIVHFHGMKHVADWRYCANWKTEYWELRNKSNFYKQLGDNCGDRRFKQYLNSVVRSDLTIVTAFDAVYHDRVFSNFELWMNTIGLREQKYLIFYNGFRSLSTQTRPFRQYKNVEFVPWSMNNATTKREEMLSCFVLAVPTHIRSKFWMKLDGDCKPKVSEFEFPDYAKFTITAHPWGYTKMKDGGEPTKHWLNTLDDWWGKDPLFDIQYDPIKNRRVGHARFCSFCYFEKTEFTKKLAEKCGDRLPVPTQDTLTWYVSTQQKEPVNLVNMKSQIRSA